MAFLTKTAFRGILLEKSFPAQYDTPPENSNEEIREIENHDAKIKMMVTTEEQSNLYSYFLINGSNSLVTDNQNIRWSKRFIDNQGNLIVDLGLKINQVP